MLAMRLALLAAVWSGFATAAVEFPLKVAKDWRHLVDQKERPFLYHADTGWHLFQKLSRAEVEQYLENRRRKGFTAIQVQLLVGGEHTPSREGGEPFATLGDLATPNERFFAHVDWVIGQAGRRGLLMVVAPAWLGCCKGGWRDRLRANGPGKVREFGRFLGRRYRRVPNLLWLQGGDRHPEGYLDLLRALAAGIEETDPIHLHTALFNSPNSAAEILPDDPWLDLNSTYTYAPNIPGVGKPQLHVYAASLRDYRRAPVRPFVLLESAYENERKSTPQWIRRQAYWSVLSGSTGQAIGNLPIYLFEPGWQAAMDAAASRDMERMAGLLQSVAWHKLQPDPEHRLVTAGYGTFSATSDPEVGFDYATAAMAEDGTLALVYLPTVRSITVDFSRMRGRVRARWFDPTSGRFTPAEGSPLPSPGSRELSPPSANAEGSGDFVLVLEGGKG